MGVGPVKPLSRQRHLVKHRPGTACSRSSKHRADTPPRQYVLPGRRSPGRSPDQVLRCGSGDVPGWLRDALKGNGLEEEGRFHFIAEPNPENGRVEELRRLVSEEAGCEDRPVWVSFNWAEQLDLDVVIRQQEAITEFVQDSRLTVKTAVLEWVLDEWPGAMQRRAQLLHVGALWLSKAGLALSPATDSRGWGIRRMSGR